MIPIGTIHTPFTSLENMPIQPKGAKEIEGKIILEEQYSSGLSDLEGFSHIYVLYHFHQAKRVAMRVTPFMDSQKRGVFATRSPLRPNHIGISIVKLVSINGSTVLFKGADMLDGTPVLDIKPYIDTFDKVDGSKSGWMVATDQEVSQKRSDNRFL